MCLTTASRNIFRPTRLLTTLCVGFVVGGGVRGGEIDEASVGVVDSAGVELKIGDDEEDITHSAGVLIDDCWCQVASLRRSF